MAQGPAVQLHRPLAEYTDAEMAGRSTKRKYPHSHSEKVQEEHALTREETILIAKYETGCKSYRLFKNFRHLVRSLQ
jgi:hypothetical protein